MRSADARPGRLRISCRPYKNTNINFEFEKYTTERTGGSAASVYRDINPALPSGALNPYFNELYTEYYHRKINSRSLINSSRLTAVYDLKLPRPKAATKGSKADQGSTVEIFALQRGLERIFLTGLTGLQARINRIPHPTPAAATHAKLLRARTSPDNPF